MVAEKIQENVARGDSQDSDADKYFQPFKLACESKHARIMEAALDCLQKLIGELNASLRLLPRLPALCLLALSHQLTGFHCLCSLWVSAWDGHSGGRRRENRAAADGRRGRNNLRLQ